MPLFSTSTQSHISQLNHLVFIGLTYTNSQETCIWVNALAAIPQKMVLTGLPWQPAFPLQGAWVRSLVRGLRSHMGWGRGLSKRKKNKKPWSSLSSLADFRSMCLSHGRLFNKYLSGIKDMSFFLIPLSKELFSSKISNPWVTLATQSDDGYRATQMPQNSRWVTLGWKSLRKYWCLWRAQEA